MLRRKCYFPSRWSQKLFLMKVKSFGARNAFKTSNVILFKVRTIKRKPRGWGRRVQWTRAAVITVIIITSCKVFFNIKNYFGFSIHVLFDETRVTYHCCNTQQIWIVSGMSRERVVQSFKPLPLGSWRQLYYIYRDTVKIVPVWLFDLRDSEVDTKLILNLSFFDREGF